MGNFSIDQLYLLERAEMEPETKARLLQFNRDYQIRVLKYFAKLKILSERECPEIVFPGLFAEVDSISGKIRPLTEQKAWSWGDCRGLGIWSYFLCKGVVPDKEFFVCSKSINLRNFYLSYCDYIYEKLKERRDKNGGRVPFLVDVHTNMPSDDPRNIPTREGELEPGHIFAAAGFAQYGILRADKDIFDTGIKFLNESFECGMSFANVDHITKERSENHAQGFVMVVLGAIVDILKCLKYGRLNVAASVTDDMIGKGRRIMDYILSSHFDETSGRFWEYNTPDEKPFVNKKGHLICDPGHSVEFCGFAAEFCDFLLPAEAENAVKKLIDILDFVNKSAYSRAGVMYKNIDVYSVQGVVDKTDADGKEYKTAPWWNVRECAAAAIKLYKLSGAQSCLDAYKKAQNATYLNYPNVNLDGLMTQTLDAETLESLPFNPATGNLDPMHSPRAREREIEALELL